MPSSGGNKLPVGCKPDSGSAVTAEAAGSSPVVPATSIPCHTDLLSRQLFGLEDDGKAKNELVPLSLVVPEDATPIAQVAPSVLQAKHAQMDARAPTAPQEKAFRRRRRNHASAAAPTCLLRSCDSSAPAAARGSSWKREPPSS